MINGKLQSTVDISNRGLAYGDGLFETIRLLQGQPAFLDLHLKRLQRGCERLGIADCRMALEQDIALLSEHFAEQGVLKIIITRGSGGRGYRPAANSAPLRILSLHPAPDYGDLQPEQGVAAFICQQRLARQPVLAGIKHLNRLEQVLASAEWPDDPHVLEGLMLDTEDHVVEGSKTNLFWVSQGQLYTPALTFCGVAGIARQVLLQALGDQIQCGQWPLQTLLAADEAFVCNSVNGVWPVLSLQHGGQCHTFAAGPVTRQAQQVFKQHQSDHD